MKNSQRTGENQEREKTAVALGYFDGVHRGHAAVIRAMRETGLPVVALTFTQHPGGAPVPRLTGRALKEEALAALGVSRTVYLDYPQVREMEPEEFVRGILAEKLGAAYVGCGFNYRFGRGASAGAAELGELGARCGIRTVCVPPVYAGSVDPGAPEGERTPISSTLIRGLVRAGEIRRAGLYLGRPFALYLPVVPGRRLGRRLGLPTINQKVPEGDVRPRFGVYASFTTVDGVRRPSVTNVGVRPTVGSDCVLAETFILDYRGDLYGRTLKVELLEFLRDEKKFDGIDALKHQMKRDADRVRSLAAAGGARIL